MEQEKESNDGKTKIGRKSVYTVMGIFAIGLVIFFSGYIYMKSAVSADVESVSNPPVPADPNVSNPPNPPDPNVPNPPNPPTPDVPNPPEPPTPTNPGKVFPSGWSMISGLEIKYFKLASLTSKGLQMFSFNDPMFNSRTWLVFPPDPCTSPSDELQCVQAHYPNSFDFREPYAYYIYNPGSEVEIAYDNTITTSSKITAVGRGWHVFFWARDGADYNTLADNIIITYQDGKTLTWKEANSEKNHTVSNQIYVVVNEASIDLSTAVKRLTGKDTATEVSKIPKDAYFWAYLRRTKVPVKSIEIKDSTYVPYEERVLIDQWLAKNNLNECGDPKNTVYAGGNCLFDEATGKTIDKYEYLVKKFPDKPWLNIENPTPTPTPTPTSTESVLSPPPLPTVSS